MNIVATPSLADKIDRGFIQRLRVASVFAWLAVLIIPLLGMIWASTIARGLQKAGASTRSPDAAMIAAAVLSIVEINALVILGLPILLRA